MKCDDKDAVPEIIDISLASGQSVDKVSCNWECSQKTFKTSIKVMVVIVRSKEMVISVTVTVTYRRSRRVNYSEKSVRRFL
jgi:hypothetical protein